jgi:DNA-binding response OmpR family regulator
MAKRRRILLAESCRDTAEALALLLRLWDHDVSIAPNGHAALELADVCEPDVALAELMLPGLDGYQLARRLREHHPGTLLVALTGFGAEPYRRRSQEAGYDHHLVKPVDLVFLRELLAGGPGVEEGEPTAFSPSTPLLAWHGTPRGWHGMVVC